MRCRWKTVSVCVLISCGLAAAGEERPELARGVVLVSPYTADGAVRIDQNRALAGFVTSGDGPGFPVTLSQPGSYRLSGNLIVPDVNTTAIEITADGVTLDLGGFSIIGPVTCPGDPVTCP